MKDWGGGGEGGGVKDWGGGGEGGGVRCGGRGGKGKLVVGTSRFGRRLG